MKHLIAILFLAVPVPAVAQSSLVEPKSVEDCERIKADLAYNACLASFGPKRGERPAQTAAVDPEEEPARSTSVRDRRRGGTTLRGRGGRKAASFDVVTGRAAGRGRSSVSRGRR